MKGGKTIAKERPYSQKRSTARPCVYHDVRVAKLINNVMLDGKKDLAQSIVYNAFDLIEQRAGESPLEVFNKAMENVMPVLEVKARPTDVRHWHCAGLFRRHAPEVSAQ